MINRSKFHPTSIINAYRDIFSSELEILQQYTVEAVANFESKSVELQQYRPQLEEDTIYAWEEEYFKNAMYFPKILNGSILIAFYTLLEKTLNILITKSNQILPPVELKRRRKESDIGYYIRILDEGFKMPIDQNLVPELNNYRLIRNLFAHSGGSTGLLEPYKKNALISLVRESNDRLLYNEHTGEVIIDNTQYLIEFSLLIQKFVLPIFEELLRRHHFILTHQES